MKHLRVSLLLVLVLAITGCEIVIPNITFVTQTPEPPSQSQPPKAKQLASPVPPAPPPPPSPTQPPPPTPSPSTATTVPPASELANLTIINQSNDVICYVYISPTENKEWGPDWLGESETIGIGGSRTFAIQPGHYDLEADDCDGTAIALEWNALIEDNTTWTITGIEGTLNFNLAPTFGSVNLAAGFTPDPYTIALVSGGSIDVATQNLPSGCTGYVAEAPDFRVYWSGSTTRLRFFVQAPDDTTLIINDPNGTWFCADDFNGTLAPLVDIMNPAAGQYDIWVGTFGSNENVEATLYITEMDISPTNPTGSTNSTNVIVLQDDFSNVSSGWEMNGFDDGSTIGYNNGVYSIYAVTKEELVWGFHPLGVDNLVVEVDVTQIAAPPNNNDAFGVFCRIQPLNGDGYAFLISGDGYYAITRVVNGNHTPLVDWTYSDVINQGNAHNHMVVVCNGNYLALYVNGQWLAETYDSTYTTGDIALAAATLEDTPVEVHFDNILVTSP